MEKVIDGISQGNDPSMVITIDGPSAAGKSTVSRLVAKELKANHVSAGELYRILTREVLKHGIDPLEETEKVYQLLLGLDLEYQKPQRFNLDQNSLVLTLSGELVDSNSLRTPEVTSMVNHVAKIPEVRKELVKVQHKAVNLGLLVIEGRDMGTVIFPKAQYKFFLTASPEVRAKRRFAQSDEIPSGAKFEEVVKEIARRDHSDMTRKISPLKPAEDAVIIDTSNMSSDEVVKQIIDAVRPRT